MSWCSGSKTSFVPILRPVHGFVEYDPIVDADTGAQVSVSVAQDRAAADDSTRKAADRVAANVASFNMELPDTTAGTNRVHAAATAASGT